MNVEDTKVERAAFKSREEVLEALRAKHDLTGADLSGLDLSGIKLVAVTMAGANCVKRI
jgi:uncharacterized protein YjbI with pentapeptide repeats